MKRNIGIEKVCERQNRMKMGILNRAMSLIWEFGQNQILAIALHEDYFGNHI